MNLRPDPANVVQALVQTLLDVFEATRDLYKTLRSKEKRDHDKLLRSKGYPDTRRSEYVDEDDAVDDESILLDKAAVTREFEIGFQDLGAQFAVGDVITQTALQSQIITLQSTIITTFLYGPSSPGPISHHLSTLLAASRAAGTTSVDALSAQHQRQLSVLPPTPRSNQSPVARTTVPPPPPYPVTATSSTSASSTAIMKSNRDSWHTSLTPTNPTLAALAARPKATRSDTESTSFSGPTSFGTNSTPHTLYCLYALDLQRHASQPLSSSITSNSSPYCPYCNRSLHLSPGKSWEIFKDDAGVERCFRIGNRFVVKCHREGADGGYGCVLCSKSASVDTVCGDVKALVRHVWMDHRVGELELEEDIAEVVEQVGGRRKDSGFGRGAGVARSRSVSLGPWRREFGGSGSGRRGRGFEKEVEIVDVRQPGTRRMV
ncbi:hypothetical protein K469DRAFT_694838 [Zopfia rhizophila CBS 207.26]|uniref:Uncharacterized protein n=1 Tax=Zopfia rhizophila CBS 207.26 TaxID=1314779 RepID=A0A6A6ENN8_9PEZI|nr:hypothetical protein K469DRAFT_694838 [Zopfia rhizophila CBS 207.26]